MSDITHSCTVDPTDRRCNFVQGSNNLATGVIDYANPGYSPMLSVCIIFLVILALSTIAHVGQAIYKKTYWCLYTIVLCGVGELFGWSGRLWMNRSVAWQPERGGYYGFNDNAFMMQISTLIFSPSFLFAGLNICLGVIIRLRGQQYSRFHYKTYTLVFINCDLATLIVQAAGGGYAASAKTYEDAETGAKIMVGGVMVQAIIMVLYTLLLVDFVWHAQKKRPVRQLSPFEWLRCGRGCRRKESASLAPVTTPELKPEQSQSELADPVPESQSHGHIALQLSALCFATLVIFIRSIFRAVELLDGWTGPLVKNEKLFIALDGLMVILAMLTMNVCHPGWLLARVDAVPK